MIRKGRACPEIRIVVWEITLPKIIERIRREGKVHYGKPCAGRTVGVLVIRAYHNQVARLNRYFLPVDDVKAGAVFYPGDFGIIMRMQRQVVPRMYRNPCYVKAIVAGNKLPQQK